MRFRGSECRVPGLKPEHFRDAVHINADGVPLYTRYLLDALGYGRQGRHFTPVPAKAAAQGNRSTAHNMRARIPAGARTTGC